MIKETPDMKRVHTGTVFAGFAGASADDPPERTVRYGRGQSAAAAAADSDGKTVPVCRAND